MQDTSNLRSDLRSFFRSVVQRAHAPFVGALVFSLLLGLPGMAVAQEGDRKPGEFSAVGKEAMKVSAEGDIPAAIKMLEEAQDAAATTAVDLALLGALYVESSRPADALNVLRPLAEHPAADPALLYNAGRAAQGTGDAELSQTYFERSVALMPVSPAGRELGLIYGAANRDADAYRLLRGWTARNPNDLEARLGAIAAGLKVGRPSEVEPMFKGLPRDDPRVVVLLGQYLSLIGDATGSIQVLETIAKTTPPEMAGDVYRLLADGYINAGQSEKAIELLAGKTDGRPRFGLLLSEAYQRVGQPDKAAELLAPYAPALLDGETQGDVTKGITLSYARALAAAGRAEESLPFFKRLLEQEERNQIAWKGYGDALVAVGRRDEARAALETFRELSKSQADARRASQAAGTDPTGRAILEAQNAAQAGNTSQALAMLRQEIQLSPQDLRPRLVEVQLLTRLERQNEALKAVDTAVRDFPQSGDALYLRGIVHLGMDNKTAALEDLRKVLTLAPGHTAAMSDLAVLLAVEGEHDEARQLLEKVLELRPDDARARETLNQLGAKEQGS